MKNPVLRRSLLQFAGGSAVGLMATPAPWRLITDMALWSQNWSWIPVPPRGEPKVKFTHCALCPAGCAVRARCVEEQPVSLVGAAGVALCPYGLTVHHLPYHPARLRQPLHRGNPVPLEQATRAIAAAMARRGRGERAAVLDPRPGRTASALYRRAMASVPDGVYLASTDSAGVGIDLEKVKSILSFGVRVLDGWGTPGRVTALRPRFRLVQVDAVESRSAVMADLWLAARPGTEAALAAGLLEALRGNLPAGLAQRTGVPARRLAEAAKLLSENTPALVLGQTPSTAALNRALGAPLVELREPPVPKEWQPMAPALDPRDVADRSIRVLFIDESLPGEMLPWSEIEHKLVRENSLVVAFAASHHGYARYADYVLPAAMPSEIEHDPGTAADASASTFRVAMPLTAAPEGMADPAASILAACGLAPVEKALEQRAAAIFASGQGTLLTYADGQSVPLRGLAADAFWKGLASGGRWQDEPGPPAKPREAETARPQTPAPEVETDVPLTVLVADRPGGLATPLMSKLYQESGLRQGSNQAAIHPDTARQCGLSEGTRALLQTRCGKCEVRVLLDPGVMPGVVRLVAGPTAIDVCGGSMARAKVVRV